tara:strand:+ start:502 stop:903 length:402 start_codon:yes stop_codon:yes gene_type:complete
MKFISKIALSLTILLICFSCSSSLHQSGLGGSVNVSANADLNADVTVGGEIQGYAKESYLFGFFEISSIGPRLVVAGVGNSEVCSAAAYDAVNSSGADVIVNPKYVIESNSNLFTRTEECTVTGLKGTINTIK